MRQLREDIRAHPRATLLLLALWVASASFLAAIPRDGGFVAQVMGFVGFYVLVLPPLAAGGLIGWSRRTRGVAGGGVAALILGTALLALGQAGLVLIGRAGAAETPPPGSWGPLLLRTYEVAGMAFVGLAASAAGWLLARLSWRSQPPPPSLQGGGTGGRQRGEAARSAG